MLSVCRSLRQLTFAQQLVAQGFEASRRKSRLGLLAEIAVPEGAKHLLADRQSTVCFSSRFLVASATAVLPDISTGKQFGLVSATFFCLY